MADPKDAAINGNGFRFYRWTDIETGEETDVLSVTSIRKLCGEQWTLVAWQIANVIDVAMGTMKRTVVGPRGGVKDVRVKDIFPSEFTDRYLETDGQQGPLDDLRRWVRKQADSPRNIAALRGTITHEAIEGNVEWDRIDLSWVEDKFQRMSARDRKLSDGITEEDVNFVRNCVRHYWAMREKLPFVIIGRELQVWNLAAGYAGTFDALVWMAPDDWTGKMPKADTITVEWVRQYGGRIVLLDWKTSKGVYTDQVIQAHAYLSAEFVGTGGVIDQRLTDLLLAAHEGGLVHIRPDGCQVHLFEYREDVVFAFLGSVAFARLLANNPEPESMFSTDLTFKSEEADD